MPRSQDNSKAANDWMRRAKSNLSRASQPKPNEVFWEDLCFDAQQAVEKSLKAVLLFKNIPFRFVHDIGELLHIMAISGIQIPDNILESAELTEYALEARYPGPYEPVTDEEALRAVKIAEIVVEWAVSIIEA